MADGDVPGSPHPEVVAYLTQVGAAAEFPLAVRDDEAVAQEYLRRGRVGMVHEPVASLTPVEHVHEHDLPGGARVRAYRPTAAGLLPIVVYLHGGGWVLGNLEMQEETCRRLAASIPSVVLNVDYRLAPEHPAPAALDDCLEALAWAATSAPDLGGDASRLAVAGSSAGGNLAACAALRARDEGGPALAAQVLLLPVLDDRMDSASYRRQRGGPVLSAPQMQWYWDQYVPDVAARAHPYVAPARATDLAGLPPAIVVTAECDPLCDEGEAYAARLAAAGVPTTLRRYPGQVHGFMRLFGVLSDADRAVSVLADDLRALLSTASARP
jgi:acetyl esterase